MMYGCLESITVSFLASYFVGHPKTLLFSVTCFCKGGGGGGANVWTIV